MYKIISTGSKGNCIIYHDTIAVDMGIPFVDIKPYLYKLQLVLLSHIHFDHLNLTTIKRLSDERPNLRFGCISPVKSIIKGLVRNLDIYEATHNYDYGDFSITPVKLYHDVDNVGYRIFKGDHKLFHATDTSTLEGITAKDYDLFCIESNYNEDTINESIEQKEARGEYVYQKRSINTHLSEQQARDFIFNNRKESSNVVRLHESENI